MTKRMIIMLAAVGVVLGGVFGFQMFKARMIAQFMSSMGMPVQTVSAAPAVRTTWQTELRAVGTLRAQQGADLATEASGIVETIAFESGQAVEAGQLLVQLRDDDDAARLRDLEATVELARITHRRALEQVKANAVPQARVDADAAALKSAEAQLAQQRAIVAKKAVRAPFGGKLGIRAVDVGEYINAGTMVVTLQSLDNLFVDFLLPQRYLSILRAGLPVSAETDAFPGETFTGEIQAINAKVDVESRNVEVRAVIRNPDQRLLPGMFAAIAITAGEQQEYITLPQTAVTYNPYGSTVYVVVNESGNGEPELVARQTFVTTGDTRGDQVAILSGLDEGAMVVTAGQIKLQNGTPVKIDNRIQPTNDPNPQPVDQ